MNAAGIPGLWRDRWRDAAARLIADPGFRRWAARFPLTRHIARRRARALFDLTAGFVYSQVLLACVRLRLFDLLAESPQSATALAHRFDLPPDATARLLEAACALGLLVRRAGDRFGLGPLGAPMVGNGAVAAMVEHHAILYADLQDPLALLRATRGDSGLARYWAYARSDRPSTLDDARVAAYSRLMSASQPLVAEEVLDAYPLQRHRRLLDVGGGEGGFLIAAAAAAPHLQLMLFDLPAVAERARGRLADAGLAARSTVTGGDFHADALPRGADIVSLVRVLHDHDDAAAMHLLRAARAALPADGTLLLAEPVADTPGAEPMGAAYFGLYLLAMGQGRPRSLPHLAGMLREAGFTAPRQLPTRIPLQTSVLVSRAA